MLYLSGVIKVKFYFYRSTVLYESEVSLIKPYDCFKEKYANVSLKGDIIKSDKRDIRKNPVELETEEDIINELEIISSSECMNFSKIHNLMLSDSDINTEKLRELLREYLGNCYFDFPNKVCPIEAIKCIVRLKKSNGLDCFDYARKIETARTNTCLLKDLDITELSGYQLTIKH